jgi:hypothetical protein
MYRKGTQILDFIKIYSPRGDLWYADQSTGIYLLQDGARDK